jgi:9-cis-epoxycarotenoid dioxygenase
MTEQATNGHANRVAIEKAPKAAASSAEPSLYFKLASTLSWALESAIDSVSGLKKEGQASPYLRGNFAPVFDELFEEDLEVVEGKLPTSVDGAFLRNGPNPALPIPGG